MSMEVDSRLVELKFDNEQFEANAKESSETLSKLKKDTENFDGEEFNKFAEGMQKAAHKIDVLAQAMVIALGMVIAQVMELGAQVIKSFSFDPIIEGYNRYVDQMSSVQKIMNSQANLENDQVESALSSLSYYADETSASITAMTNALAEFMGQGIELDQSLEIVEGISNAAALSGANAEAAAHGMTGFAKAIGAGAMSLGVWNNWIATSGMTTNQQLLQAFLDGAVAVGTLSTKVETLTDGTKELSYWITDAEGNVSEAEVRFDNFKETLNSGWLSAAAMRRTFSDLSAFSLKIEEYVNDGVYSTQEILSALDAFGYGQSTGYKEYIAGLGKTADEMDSIVESYRNYPLAIRELEETYNLQEGWLDNYEEFLHAYKVGGKEWREVCEDYGLATDQGKLLRDELVGLDKDLENLEKTSGLSLYQLEESFRLYNEVSPEFEQYCKDNGYAISTLLPIVEELSKEEYNFGRKAFVAGQETKSFADAIGYVKTAVANQWTTIFKSIFGGYEEAKKLWTSLSEFLGSVFVDPMYDIADAFDEFGNYYWGIKRVRELLQEVMETVAMFVTTWRDAWSNTFETLTGLKISQAFKNLDEFKRKLQMFQGDEEFWEKYYTVVDNLATAFSRILSFMKELAIAVGPAIKSVFGVIKTLFSGLAKILFQMIDPLGEFAMASDNVMGSVVNIISNASNKIAALVDKINEFIFKLFNGDKDELKGSPLLIVLSGFLDFMVNLWNTLYPILDSIVGYVGSGVVEFFSDVFGTITSTLGLINWAAIKAFMSNLVDFSSESNIFATALRGVQTAVETSGTVLGYIWDVIKSAINPIINAIRDNLNWDTALTSTKIIALTAVAISIAGFFKSLKNIGWSFGAAWSAFRNKAIAEALKSLSEIGMAIAVMAIFPETRIVAASACLVAVIYALKRITDSFVNMNFKNMVTGGFGIKSAIGVISILVSVAAAITAISKYPSDSIAVGTFSCITILMGLTHLVKEMRQANIGAVGTILSISLPAIITFRKTLTAFVAVVAAMNEAGAKGVDFLLAAAGLSLMFLGLASFVSAFNIKKNKVIEDISDTSEALKILATGVRISIVIGAISTSLALVVGSLAGLAALVYYIKNLPGGVEALSIAAAGLVGYLIVLPILVAAFTDIGRNVDAQNLSKIGSVMLNLSMAVNACVLPIAALSAANAFFGGWNGATAVGEIIAILITYKYLILAFSHLGNDIAKVNMFKISAGLASLSVALSTLMIPIALFSGANLKTIGHGLVIVEAALWSFIGMLAVLNAMTRKNGTNTFTTLKTLSEGMIELSAGLVGIAFAATVMAGVDWLAIGKLMTVLAGVMVVLAGINYIKGKGETIRVVGESIKETAKGCSVGEKAIKLFTKTLTLLTIALGALAFVSEDTLKRFSNNVQDKLPKAAKAIEIILATAIQSLGNIIIGALPVLGDVLDKVLVWLAAKVYGWTDSLMLALVNICYAIADRAAEIGDPLGLLVAKLLKGISASILKNTDMIVDAFVAVFAAVVYAVGDLVAKLFQTVGDTVGSPEMGGRIAKSAEQFRDDVLEDLGMKEMGREAGEELADGTIEGARSIFGSHGAKDIRNIISDVGDVIYDFLPTEISNVLKGSFAKSGGDWGTALTEMGVRNGGDYANGFYNRIKGDKKIMAVLGITSEEWEIQGEEAAERMTNALKEKIEGAGYDFDLFSSLIGQDGFDRLTILLSEIGSDAESFDYILSTYSDQYEAYATDVATMYADLVQERKNAEKLQLQEYLRSNGVNLAGFDKLDPEKVEEWASIYADLGNKAPEYLQPLVDEINEALKNQRELTVETAGAATEAKFHADEEERVAAALQAQLDARAEMAAIIEAANRKEEDALMGIDPSFNVGSGNAIQDISELMTDSRINAALSLADEAQNKLAELAQEVDENGQALYSVSYDAAGLIDSVTLLSEGTTTTVEDIHYQLTHAEKTFADDAKAGGTAIATGLRGSKKSIVSATSSLTAAISSGIRSYERQAELDGRLIYLALKRGLTGGGSGVINPLDPTGGDSEFSSFTGFISSSLSSINKDAAAFASTSRMLANVLDGNVTLTITPVIDLDNFDSELGGLTAMLNGKSTQRAASLAVTPLVNGGGISPNGSVSTQTIVNFTQNNTSPKALSQYEIYRQTQNQLARLRREL